MQAILWDNDGVLVDTEELYYRATREALAGLGIELNVADYVAVSDSLAEQIGLEHLRSKKSFARADALVARWLERSAPLPARERGSPRRA